jgi:hypothetical protein
MKRAGSVRLSIRSYVSSIVAVSGFPAAWAATNVAIVSVIPSRSFANHAVLVGVVMSIRRKQEPR